MPCGKGTSHGLSIKIRKIRKIHLLLVPFSPLQTREIYVCGVWTEIEDLKHLECSTPYNVQRRPFGTFEPMFTMRALTDSNEHANCKHLFKCPEWSSLIIWSAREFNQPHYLLATSLRIGPFVE